MTLSALKGEQQVDRISNVGLNGLVRELNRGLQDTSDKASESMIGRVGVDRGQGAGMTDIERLQEIKCLASRISPTMMRSGR